MPANEDEFNLSIANHKPKRTAAAKATAAMEVLNRLRNELEAYRRALRPANRAELDRAAAAITNIMITNYANVKHEFGYSVHSVAF
jgi:hypothetical protein